MSDALAYEFDDGTRYAKLTTSPKDGAIAYPTIEFLFEKPKGTYRGTYLVKGDRNLTLYHVGEDGTRTLILSYFDLTKEWMVYRHFNPYFDGESNLGDPFAPFRWKDAGFMGYLGLGDEAERGSMPADESYRLFMIGRKSPTGIGVADQVNICVKEADDSYVILNLVRHGSRHICGGVDTIIEGDILPADIGLEAQTGTSNYAPRQDHVHKHPVFTSGDLHTEYAEITDAETITGLWTFKDVNTEWETPDANSTNTTRDSPSVVLRGKYWDGAASVDRDAKIFHDITDTTPLSQIAFEIAGTRIANLTDAGALEINEIYLDVTNKDIRLYRVGANELGLADQLSILGRTNLNALVIGSATEEGGDIVVYKDAVGTVGFKVDADLGRVYVDRIDEITSGAGVRLEPNIAVGTAPSLTKLVTLWKNFTVTGWVHGLRVTVLNSVDNPTTGVIGLEFTSKAQQGATEKIYEVRGLYGASWAQTNGTVTSLLPGVFWSNVPSGYTPTITNVYGLRIGRSQLRDATVTNYFGIEIHAPAIDLGSLIRAYGLKVEEPTIGTTNWCALFEGDVQINSDKKLILEGSGTVKGDTYIVFNSTKNRIEFYLNGVLEGWIDTTGFVSA